MTTTFTFWHKVFDMELIYVTLAMSILALGLGIYNFLRARKRPVIKGNTITDEKGKKVYAERFDD